MGVLDKIAGKVVNEINHAIGEPSGHHQGQGRPPSGYQQGGYPGQADERLWQQPAPQYGVPQAGRLYEDSGPYQEQGYQHAAQQSAYGVDGSGYTGGYGVPTGGQGYGPAQPGMQQTPPAPQGATHMHQGRVTGRRKAFSAGCNYAGTSSALNGCINDSKCMVYLLKNRFGFQDEDILLMTDDQADPNLVPTRRNILQGLRWLVQGCQPGDSLFFHYSGHGSQTADYSGDERDRKNETLCPTDYDTAGMIVDDELNELLINPLPQGVRLHAVIDACHSGTVMDLPYSCKTQQGRVDWATEYSHPTSAYKGTAGGLAIQFGAASDDQTAADTAALSGNVATGAATFSFIQAIEQRGTAIGYGELLHQMHRTLKSMDKGSSGGGGTNILDHLMTNGLSMDGMLVSLATTAVGGLSGGYSKQTPVMSSNEAFDLNMPINI
ncbi:hypothetical protein WJX72_004748 [[Myrmecia] bisecta]|uniref:Peptidase C14 caspase domain-containing protein n=1 Tax=[Myrmecia] bisecta TaxID=41462 RepID=A0AAW1QFI5_9CHLO